MKDTPVSFSDITYQVNLINGLILANLSSGCDDHIKDASNFSRHLLSTKNWFSRISWPNKKRFMLALLYDVTSVWTLSLILKSIWNCRPKSAVLSISGPYAPFSSFDEVPLDHNRTALPTETLVQVMRKDRQWFIGLDPESQAKVITELLTVSGGPIMWEVLSNAQKIYHTYRQNQLENLRESFVALNEREPPEKNTSPLPFRSEASEGESSKAKLARKVCDDNIIAWNEAMKSLRHSLKLEEVETMLNDGTPTKVWKVNRPKPEGIETVDFVQLLPSAIAKRILRYLPQAQLAEYAKVNKYWAFLAHELSEELSIRVKLNTGFGKLQELMMKHEHSIRTFDQPDTSGMFTSMVSEQHKAKFMESIKYSEKSGGGYSFRLICAEKLYKPPVNHKPIRNMAEMTERLERRGAADENVWKWCINVLKINKIKKPDPVKKTEGLMHLGYTHFPCPLMQHTVEVPLHVTLRKDPAKSLMCYAEEIENEYVSGIRPQIARLSYDIFF